MEEGVSDRKYDKNEINDEEKEAECPYDNPKIDMEKGVSERKNDKNEKPRRKKRQNAQMTLLLMIWRKV